MPGVPDGYARLTPYLLYADATAAREFLTSAFGFVEVEGERFTDDAGRITHTAMKVVDQVVMLGSPGASFRGPAAVGSTVHLYVYVDDIEALHARATEAGAAPGPIETADYGDKRFIATDPEGHQWWFAEYTG